jgi:excisionase family DNA binding protein
VTGEQVERVLGELAAIRAELAALRSAPPTRLYAAPDEVAKVYGVSLRSVRQWVANGAPHVRCGRAVRLRLRDLDAWLDARQTAKGPDRRAAGGAP